MTSAGPGVAAKLASRIDDLPVSARTRARRGFDVAANLGDDQRQSAMRFVLNRLAERASIHPNEVMENSGLELSDASVLSFCISVVFGILTDTTASTQEFLTSAVNVLYGPEAEPAVRQIADAIVARRSELKLKVDNATLATSILPSLRYFDVGIDIRLDIAAGKLVRGVPVAVCYIDTDAAGQELWLQLTYADVETMKRRFEELYSNMTIALGASARMLETSE